MKSEVSATEAARNLSEYLNRVAYRGERFVIRRGNRPLAELRPVTGPLSGPALLQLLECLPRLSEEELDSLESDIDEGRRAIPPLVEPAWNT